MTNWTVNCDECGKVIYSNKSKIQDSIIKVKIKSVEECNRVDVCSKQCLRTLVNKYIEDINENENVVLDIDINVETIVV